MTRRDPDNETNRLHSGAVVWTDAREAVVAAAIRSFAAYGFEGASLRGIADMAGVTPRSIRTRFGGKEGLWLVCAQSIAVEADPIIERIAHLSKQSDRSLSNRLSDIVHSTAAFFQINPHVRDFIFRAISESPERVEFIVDRIVLPAYEAGRPTIAESIEHDIVRCTHPAFFFVAMASAFSRSSLAPVLFSRIAPELPPSEINWRMTQAVRSMLLRERATANGRPG